MEKMPVSQQASQEAVSLFDAEALNVMAWTPNYLVNSAWLEHLPFAFWLTLVQRPTCFVELGTHRGASFFAFCQAVSELQLPTRCYAIDNWQGDEHAGHYGEDIYKAVKEHNEEHYSRFAQLLRKDFNEAVEYFEDQSIDLLHIDGFHTYEAVKNDFETWLPKLTENAVVIFHDTNVHEREFGVFKFFGELKEKYRHFEFSHGYGLGVIFLGAPPEKMHFLNDEELPPAQKYRVENLFSRLGAAVKFNVKLNEAKQKLEERRIELKRKEDKIKVVELECKEAIADAKKEVEETVSQAKKEAEKIISQSNAQWEEFAAIKNKEIAELTKLLLKKDKQMEKITSSTSWKVTAPLRTVVNKLRQLTSK